MKKELIILLSLLSIFLATSAFGEVSRVCTENEAGKAEVVAGKARNWDELYKSYKLYRHCDDGAIGEGFSESVTLILSESWSQIVRLKKLIQKDDGFEAFVLKHIDETVPEERLELLVKLAANKCPPSAKTLCKKIRSAASHNTP